MTRPYSLFTTSQRAFIQDPGLIVVALQFSEHSKIMQDFSRLCIRDLRGVLQDVQGALVQSLRLLVLSMPDTQPRQIIQTDGHFRVLCSVRLLVNRQGAPVERLRLVIPPPPLI